MVRCHTAQPKLEMAIPMNGSKIEYRKIMADKLPFSIAAIKALAGPHYKKRMKTAVCTLGKMNPPHKGHSLVIRKILQLANSLSADPFVFISPKQRPNSIPYWSLIDILTDTYGKCIIRNEEIKNVFDMLYLLKDHKYEKVIVVVGSDRVDEFTKCITPYLGKDDELGLPYEFEIISAGERTPEGSGVAGLSSTIMREWLDNWSKENERLFIDSLPDEMELFNKYAIMARLKVGMSNES